MQAATVQELTWLNVEYRPFTSVSPQFADFDLFTAAVCRCSDV